MSDKKCNMNHCDACLNCGVLKSAPIIEEAANIFIRDHNKHSTNYENRQTYHAAMQAKNLIMKARIKLREFGINI